MSDIADHVTLSFMLHNHVIRFLRFLLKRLILDLQELHNSLMLNICHLANIIKERRWWLVSGNWSTSSEARSQIYHQIMFIIIVIPSLHFIAISWSILLTKSHEFDQQLRYQPSISDTTATIDRFSLYRIVLCGVRLMPCHTASVTPLPHSGVII